MGTIGGDLAALDKALRKLVSRGHRLQVLYEAGPCGFVIWRHLAALGTECAVVAPSSVPKRSGDRVKTERRDAMNLARLHRFWGPHRGARARRGRRGRARPGAREGRRGARVPQRSPPSEGAGASKACSSSHA